LAVLEVDGKDYEAGGREEGPAEEEYLTQAAGPRPRVGGVKGCVFGFGGVVGVEGEAAGVR
jgi:hypothetical protein